MRAISARSGWMRPDACGCPAPMACSCARVTTSCRCCAMASRSAPTAAMSLPPTPMAWWWSAKTACCGCRPVPQAAGRSTPCPCSWTMDASCRPAGPCWPMEPRYGPAAASTSAGSMPAARSPCWPRTTACPNGNGARSFAIAWAPCGCAVAGWCSHVLPASTCSAIVRRQRAPDSTPSPVPRRCRKMRRAAC